MRGEKYSFSNEMKQKAHKKAELFNPQKTKDVHHILPRYFAKKYNVPENLVNNEHNAIALEKDFHSWIHGNRLTKRQLIEVLGNDISELEKRIDDNEIEWKGLSEEDYIFLAVAYLGIAEEYFQERRFNYIMRKKSAR